VSTTNATPADGSVAPGPGPERPGAGGGAAAEELARRSHTPAQRIQHLLHGNPFLSAAVILVLTAIVFTMLNPRFSDPRTLSLLVQQTAVVAALAIGQTLIILTAGIDLSVGAIAILSMMVMAKLSSDRGVPGLLALLIGIAVDTRFGFLEERCDGRGMVF